MPKMKTHSGAKKRFRKTAKGKLRGRRAYSSHILEKKSPKRKRQHAQAGRDRPAGRQARQHAAGREGAQVSRATNAVARRKRRKKTLERAKGYYGRKHSSYRFANEQLMRSGDYAYRDRRNAQARVPAPVDHADQRRRAARGHELLGADARPASEAGVEVNRKMLADIAVRDPEAFRRFAELGPGGRRGVADGHMPTNSRAARDAAALLVQDRT